MEFQKFLLEYQRVSSAQAVGLGDGQGAVGLWGCASPRAGASPTPCALG